MSDEPRQPTIGDVLLICLQGLAMFLAAMVLFQLYINSHDIPLKICVPAPTPDHSLDQPE